MYQPASSASTSASASAGEPLRLSGGIHRGLVAALHEQAAEGEAAEPPAVARQDLPALRPLRQQRREQRRRLRPLARRRLDARPEARQHAVDRPADRPGRGAPGEHPSTVPAAGARQRLAAGRAGLDVAEEARPRLRQELDQPLRTSGFGWILGIDVTPHPYHWFRRIDVSNSRVAATIFQVTTNLMNFSPRPPPGAPAMIPGVPMTRLVSLPSLAGRPAPAARHLGGARPPAGARRPLVPAAAGQPRHRRAEHPAAAEDPPLPPHPAAGADRPPGVRSGGGGGGRRARPRAGDPAPGAGVAGGALRPRDRPRLQRLLLLPDRLLALQAAGAVALPGAARLLGRGRPRRAGPRLDGGLPDEPPEQHGLRPGGLPGRRPHRPLLRGRRMGADLAAADPDPLDRRLLRAAQLGRSPLPAGPRALHPHGDGGGGAAGGLSGRGAVARRPAAPAEARHPRLHAALLRSRPRRPRPGVHPGGDQLRPGAGGPHPAARPRARGSANATPCSPPAPPCASSAAISP